MRAAPYPNDDETHLDVDRLVADPLSDETDRLWNETAGTNRQVFSEIFKPVPSNFVRDWKAYGVRHHFFLIQNEACMTNLLTL
jgi:phospholipase D1/2